MPSPEPDRHTIVVTAEARHIDELDHVGNLQYLQWVLDVARAHSDARGWDVAAYAAAGATWVVRRHAIEYAVSARLGDRIAVTTWVDDWKRASCERATELVRVADDRVLARARTTWAFVSAQGRPTRIPEALRERF